MKEAVPKGETVLLHFARDKFVAVFGRSPVAAAAAPSRVNLIGDHIDYCEGFVLPVALPFLTVIAGGYNNTGQCNVMSVLENGDEVKTSFPATTHTTQLKPGEPAWANYIKGVLANFPSEVNGFDAVIVADVPMGAGLSSSASIEVAMFTFLEALTGKHFDPVTKAKLCQKAEHEFPGMPCGIMDQYISAMGRKDHALLIDCRSLESFHIPMDIGEAVVLVTNSNVKHKLTGSEYPQRRAHCEEATKMLGLSSLRDATPGHLEELEKLKADKLVIMRTKHVINEISWTEKVSKALAAQDLALVGELFYKSHDSLSKLMEVSCPESDQIVEVLKTCTGVYGARMTGGGFGGCVVSLVNKKHVEEVKKNIMSHYKGNPTFFICQPSDGARILKL
ncbi:galactokinase-like [Hyposmocoma kahamanoa]|uniref:galactokinase-like n=1 Tax=Hyposmocoma kahamanoa TaxID=1477025 RepID=UPI000E6D5D80|nr:galactokinase-like [Hyposmocoma kahamanoa]